MHKLNSKDCANLGTRGQTQKRTAERDMVKNKERGHLGFKSWGVAEVVTGEWQRLRQGTGQLGGGGSMAPFSMRRGGIEDNGDINYIITIS